MANIATNLVPEVQEDVELVYSYSTSSPGAGGFGGFEDIFSGGSVYRNVPAADTEAAITLSFSEAFLGTQKRLQLDGETLNVRIPSGAKPGSQIRIKGKGRLKLAAENARLKAQVQALRQLQF